MVHWKSDLLLLIALVTIHFCQGIIKQQNDTEEYDDGPTPPTPAGTRPTIAPEVPKPFQDCPKIFDREEWLARAALPDRSDALILPLSKVVFLQTAGSECDQFSQCADDVRSIQNYHMATKGWDDIGYNFLIGGDGSIFEGKGWHIMGSFNRRFNRYAFGVAFIGNFAENSRSTPTYLALNSAKNFLRCAVSKGYLSADYLIHGVYINEAIISLIK